MEDKIGMFLLRRRINKVLPHIHGKLLDIGCGTNELVKAYSGEGLGVDVYPWSNVDLLVKDTSNLEFDDKSFDTVTIVAAINHIPNRNQVFMEIHRLLKDNGVFIMTTVGPKKSRIWHWLRRNSDVDQTERGMKEGEVWGLTDSELDKLLLESGFKMYIKDGFNLNLCHIIMCKKI